MCDIFLYHYQQTLKQSFGIVGGKDLVSLCTARQQSQYHNEKKKELLNIMAQVFIWFTQNYSLWLYPKYFMSSENLTKYYLTISIKWKGWTFPANLVQIFVVKNRSWCDVSNKTISYVILYCMYEKPYLRWGSISSTLVKSCLENLHLASHWLRIIFIQWLLLCECWR